MEIRSYRRVFDLERRIYRIDRLRLNPSGVPLRGVAYFLIALAVGLVAGRLPLVGALMGLLPWYMRQLLVPACSAALLTVIAVEGRPFHLAVVALLRHRLGPRRVAGFRHRPRAGTRWRPEPMLLLPDGSERRVRRFRYHGPGAIRIGVEHEMQEAGTSLSLRGRTPGLRPTLRLVERPGARTLRKGHIVALLPGTQLFVERDG